MSLLFHGLFIELISHPPNGQDPFRLAIIFLYGLSQAANVDVDGPGRDKGFATPDAIEELIAI